MIFSASAGLALLAVLARAQANSINIDRLYSRDLDLEDYSGLRLRDAYSDDHEDLFTRDYDIEDLDSLIGVYARQPVPAVMKMAARNTPQDIEKLCSNPLPSVQDFVSFYSRSGLPSNSALFWSGIKDSKAMEIAQGRGKVTLEMMVKPNNVPLKGCDVRMQSSESQKWWDHASEAFGTWTDAPISVIFSEKRHGEIKAGGNKSTWLRVEVKAIWRKLKSKFKAAMSAVGRHASQKAQPKDIQMYICDSEGNNVKGPMPYDGPVDEPMPVSGNAPGVKTPAKR